MRTTHYLHRQSSAYHAAQHSGVALVIVMIFIVALSIIAAFSINSSNLSERLARNQLDIQLARESAEAALRDAEADLLLSSDVLRAGAFCRRENQRPVMDNLIRFTSNCNSGQCFFADSYYQATNYSTATLLDGEPWWPSNKGGRWNDVLATKPTAANVNCGFTGGVPYGVFTGRAALPGVSRQPEYLIELFRRNTFGGYVFRITARGFGRGPNTEVVLQTYFKPPTI
jgi:type IV pilus assembly protein PilX